MMKSDSYYVVPDENWQRIHFIRPRFKGDIENVLLFMANECCKIPSCSCKEYNSRYFNAIKMFPGNIDKTAKTLNNWRTETPALFGFYKEDKDLDITRTSKMAYFLNEHQDLTQFLRLFLLTFQFPGGHLKPQELVDIIDNNIRFKPAKWIINVLLAGEQLLASTGKQMSISSLEATYCIFNDLRVTSGKVSPKEVAKTILSNRKNHLKYYNKQDKHILSRTKKPMSEGDVKRYAQDILDYMELAYLVENHNGYYYLKPNELQAINVFANDNTFFKGYEPFYKQTNYQTYEISAIEPLWFDYVNNSLNTNIFETDIKTLLPDNCEIKVICDDRIQSLLTSDLTTRKDIGNLGEALICGHEKMRLKIAGYNDLVKLVRVVDSAAYHPGFDIDSFEGDGTICHRYIEVKTTISKQKISLFAFHMTPNEWSVAETNKEHYYVYRLMISQNEKTLYILKNPVGLYKSDKIKAAPRDGMEISFSNSDFDTTELLLWKN